MRGSWFARSLLRRFGAPSFGIILVALGCSSDGSQDGLGDLNVGAAAGSAGHPSAAGMGMAHAGAGTSGVTGAGGVIGTAGVSASGGSAGQGVVGGSGPVDPGAGGLGPSGSGGSSGVSFDAGSVDPGDAGADAASPIIGECEPEETKAAEGEGCRADSECRAGLLCGDANGEPGTCRPIEGLALVRTFRPEGRLEAANAQGRGEYSEGIDFAHGFLWQATPYVLHQIDVEAETVVASYGTPSAIEYREGVSWRDDSLLQASYRNNDIYAAELQPNGRIGEFALHRELDDLSQSELGRTRERRNCVYGIEDRCGVLYTTRCGAPNVDTYQSGESGGRTGTFAVRDAAGRALPAVEDMEIYLGQLWISTFAGDALGYNDVLFRVDLNDAANGVATAVDSYEITACTTRSGAPTIALDGVAANRATRELYVTGKDCPILVYQVE